MIYMAGIDHNSASLSLREGLAANAQSGDASARVLELHGVSGAVLLSTCNRSELYVNVNCEEEQIDCAKALCDVLGANYDTFAPAFFAYGELDAAKHLCEVACGLHSRVWGEDQILAQVKNAIAMAREAQSSCAELEQLFRCAVTAAKRVKTDVKLTAVARSAPDMAADLLSAKTKLAGRKVLVIGSGEMGKLSASVLRARGCDVTMTLRTYKHGTVVVPEGCSTCNYSDRYEVMLDMDIVVSATASPHYTVEYEKYAELSPKPSFFVDLAVPRDIQEPIECIDIDDIGVRCGANDEQLAAIYAIIDKQLERFENWRSYKRSIELDASAG